MEAQRDSTSIRVDNKYCTIYIYIYTIKKLIGEHNFVNISNKLLPIYKFTRSDAVRGKVNANMIIYRHTNNLGNYFHVLRMFTKV